MLNRNVGIRLASKLNFRLVSSEFQITSASVLGWIFGGGARGLGVRPYPFEKRACPFKIGFHAEFFRILKQERV